MKNSKLQTAQKIISPNGKLKISATITMILGFLSVLALILIYLALSDIAHGGEDLKLEWYAVGVSLLIISTFTVSTFFTLGFLMKIPGSLEDNSLK